MGLKVTKFERYALNEWKFQDDFRRKYDPLMEQLILNPPPGWKDENLAREFGVSLNAIYCKRRYLRELIRKGKYTGGCCRKRTIILKTAKLGSRGPGRPRRLSEKLDHIHPRRRGRPRKLDPNGPPHKYTRRNSGEKPIKKSRCIKLRRMKLLPGPVSSEKPKVELRKQKRFSIQHALVYFGADPKEVTKKALCNLGGRTAILEWGHRLWRVKAAEVHPDKPGGDPEEAVYVNYLYRKFKNLMRFKSFE